MKNQTDTRKSTLEVNRDQKDYYEKKVTSERSIGRVTQAWEAWRDSVYRVWSEIGVFDDVLDLHRTWLGDVSGKRVLDLGCFTGNSLSLPLAKESGYYLGIDLSNNALDILRSHFDRAEVKGAEVRCMDFLEEDFDYEPFDIIYAKGVLHHFEDFDLVMSLLHERLAPDGRIVSYDPLDTAPIVRFVRAIYRPFQSNAAWEWPFRKDNFDIIKKYFVIEQVQGVGGRSKWVIPLSVLPIFRNAVIRLGRKLHQSDKRAATSLDDGLWRCMSVSMCLRKK